MGDTYGQSKAIFNSDFKSLQETWKRLRQGKDDCQQGVRLTSVFEPHTHDGSY